MDDEIDIKSGSFQKGDAIDPDQAMELAINVAKAGTPFVAPNPVVGCVIVDRLHRFLASGYHHKYGEAHAEIDALQKLSAAELKDSSFYVTLEPCAHQGKTGSCAEKIATLGVKKVVYGIVDPNPLVAGKGAKILTAAAIDAVEYQGLLKDKLFSLCEVFLKNLTEKKIFIAAKVASSLDGQIALKSGESRWITSEASRNYVHELRSYYDGLIVGRKTIEIDNPSLNIRHSEITKDTQVIILDPSCKLLNKIDQGQKFKFLELHDTKNIYFAVTQHCKSAFQQIVFTDLNNLMEQLWDLKFRSVFVEGGAETYSSFLQAEIVDRLYLFLAPVIIGASNGLSWTNTLGIADLENKFVLKQIEIKHLGADLLISGKLRPGSKSKNC